MNAGLRQAINVAGLGTGASAALLCYYCNPPAVRTESDGSDAGVLLKEDGVGTFVWDIEQKEFGSGRQIGVKFFGARSMLGSPPGGGEGGAVGGVGFHLISGLRFLRWKRSNFFAGFGLPELGGVVPFFPFLPEVLLVGLDRAAKELAVGREIGHVSADKLVGHGNGGLHLLRVQVDHLNGVRVVTIGLKARKVFAVARH